MENYSYLSLKRIGQYLKMIVATGPTLALTATISISGCAPEPKAEIAAFGDSVTWGYGGLPEGWMVRLQNRTGYEFSNLGIPGEKAEEGASRITGALRTVPNAKTIIVMHGGNNWVGIFRGDPCKSSCEPDTEDAAYERVAESLRTIRSRIKKAKRKTVFGTYWPGVESHCNYSPENWLLYQKHLRYLNDKIKKVAAEHDDPVVDLGDLFEISDERENYFDCLHPSGKGYDMITDRWLEDIQLWKPEKKWLFEF